MEVKTPQKTLRVMGKRKSTITMLKIKGRENSNMWGRVDKGLMLQK